MRFNFFTVALVVGMITAVRGQGANGTDSFNSDTSTNQTNPGNDSSPTNPNADNNTTSDTSPGSSGNSSSSNGTESTENKPPASNSTNENSESSSNSNQTNDTNVTASNSTNEDSESPSNSTTPESNTNMNETNLANATSANSNESTNAGNSSENVTSPNIDEENNSTLTNTTVNNNESNPIDSTDVNETNSMNMTNSNETNSNDTITPDMSDNSTTSANMTDENGTMNMTNTTNETKTTNMTDMNDDSATNTTDMTNSNETSSMNNTNPTVGTDAESGNDQNGTGSTTPCKLPDDLTGVWWSTIWGVVTFTDSRIVAQGDQQLVFECFAKDDETENYILRLLNSSFSLIGEEDVFTCVKFDFRNTDNVHFQILTDRSNISVGSEPLVIKVINETVDFGEICTAMEDRVLQSDLLRKGREIEGALGCPDALKGSFNVTYTGQTASKCPNGATMSSCEMTKTLVYNYTNCNGTQDFSGENKYICVSGGADEVTTFRNSTEENDFTPFACLDINSTEDSSSPLPVLFRGFGCGDRWSIESAGGAEVSYTLSKNDDCSEETEPDGGGNLTQSIVFTTALALLSSVISRWS